MSLTKISVTLGFIAFAALSRASPAFAQTQSTCPAKQRREIALTAVDKDGAVIETLRAKHLSLKVGGSAPKKEQLEAGLTEIARHLRGNYVVGYCGGSSKARAKVQVEVIDPELRKAKPVLVYKRFQH